MAIGKPRYAIERWKISMTDNIFHFPPVGEATPDIEDNPNQGLPFRKIKAGHLEQIVDETEQAVIEAERGLYKRGGLVVRIGEAELLGATEPKTTALVIVEQGEHTLFEDAGASAVYLKYNKREDKWEPADPTLAIIRAWQGRGTRLRLPLLQAIISAPLILPTGRVIERPGYDTTTGFYDVWADSSYRSDEIEEKLGRRGLKSRIHHRAYRNRKLSEAQKAANATRSKVRASSMYLVIKRTPWEPRSCAPSASFARDARSE
jgi:hypothetical protein